MKDSFIDYKEETALKPIPYSTKDFLQAALHALPQYCKEPDVYGLFIVEALDKCQQPKNSFHNTEINDILKSYADTIKNEHLIDESPKIWHAYFHIIIALYTFAKFHLKTTDDIYAKFPEGRAPVDWVNEAKWFLYSYYQFDQDVYIPNHPIQEIADALHMPVLINNRIERYSRLIAISICRVVINNARLVEPQKAINVITRYVKQLTPVYKRYKNVFQDEFENAMDEGIFMSLAEIESKLR